jgi:tRNA threonylcarbamoyladenosine biosynthesis protein TsaE
MNEDKIFVTNNFTETQSLGEKFAKTLKGGKLIALYGNLGGGKTTFVQGMALGLGIKNRVISPTFIIIRSYKIKRKTQNAGLFYHVDLYRTETVDDIKGLGIDEFMLKSNNIVVIEWAEKMKDFLPKQRIDVYFTYLEENKREIKFINNGISNR